MRACPEAGHAGAGDLAWRGLEVPGLDALDRVDHDSPASLEVFSGQRLFPILLQTRRPADGEDVLPHAAPDPVLRVPQRQETGLKSERVALVVDSVLAREVVQRQLDVVQLRTEIHLIRDPHVLARAGLVVDDLDLAVADIVDAVDLAYDLDSVQLEVESLLDGQGAQAADELHSRDGPWG